MQEEFYNQEIIDNKYNKEIATKSDILHEFENVDFQRARFWTLSASVATAIPRRLGYEADRAELTMDKRVSRRVCYMYYTLWEMYSKKGLEAPMPPKWSEWPKVVVDPLIARIGSTVIWINQVNYLLNVVQRRIALLEDMAEINNMRERRSPLRSKVGSHQIMLKWEVDYLHRIIQFADKPSDFRHHQKANGHWE